MDCKTYSGIFQNNESEDYKLKQFQNESNLTVCLKWEKVEGVSHKDHPKFYKNKRFQENVPLKEKEILDQKVRLHDGTIGDVVTCFLKGESWTYYCHPCMQESSSWEIFESHIESVEHKAILMRSSHSRAKFLIKSPNNDLIMNKDSGTTPCKIQEKLDNYLKPLLGLEYLVESQIGVEEINMKSIYYCLLCDTISTEEEIFMHLSSKEHCLQYFLMFFPTVLEKLKVFATTNSSRTFLIDELIDHIAARIETDFGRLKPVQIDLDRFAAQKMKVLADIDCGKHFRETEEKNFAACVYLTHLHDVVCPVMTYQEKWLKLQKKCNIYDRTLKTDTEKNDITNETDLDSETHKCNIPKDLQFEQSTVTTSQFVNTIANQLDSLDMKRNRMSRAQKRKKKRFMGKLFEQEVTNLLDPHRPNATEERQTEETCERPDAFLVGHSDNERSFNLTKCMESRELTQPMVSNNSSYFINLTISPYNYPLDRLTTEQGNLILTALSEAMERTDTYTNDFIYFHNCHVEKGTVTLACVNQTTVNWIKSILPKLSLWEGAKLIVDKNATKELTKVYFKTNKYLANSDPNSIMYMLDKQNPILNVSDWKVMSNKKEATGQSFDVLVDSAVVQMIRDIDYKAFLSLWQVLFVVMKGDEPEIPVINID